MAGLPVDRPVGEEGVCGSDARNLRSTRRSSRRWLRALEIRDCGLELGEAGLHVRLPAAEIGQLCRLGRDLLGHGLLLGEHGVAVGVDRLRQLRRVAGHAIQVLLERWIHGLDKSPAIFCVATSFQDWGWIDRLI